MKFADRKQAGELLAEKLTHYKDLNDAIVLGLPRGGLPVAVPIAKQCHLPLDALIVRKLGVPWHEELAFGACAYGGIVVFNEDVISSAEISKATIDKLIQVKQKEINDRNRIYRNDAPPPDVKDKTVIIVDDGLATGATMRAACASVKSFKPAKVVIAVPVGSQDVCDSFESIVDEVICYYIPDRLFGVGAWYEDFTQTTDEEVVAILEDKFSS